MCRRPSFDLRTSELRFADDLYCHHTNHYYTYGLATSFTKTNLQIPDLVWLSVLPYRWLTFDRFGEPFGKILSKWPSGLLLVYNFRVADVGWTSANPNSQSEFADANSEFADANSEFADANSKFPSLQSGT